MENRLVKEDLADLDFIDAEELASDGTFVYKTLPATSVVSGTVTVNPSADYEGLVFGDDPVEAGDGFVLSGATAGNGTYTVNAVVDNTSFTVVEAIVDSTGGSINFTHPEGALKVGVDPTSITNSSSTNVQEVLEDLDSAISGGGLTPASHRDLDQLVHLIAETSYLEVTRTAGRVSDVIYWTDNTKTTKVRETNVTRTSGQVSSVVIKQYDAVGVLAETLTGTVNRTGGQVDDIDWVLT